MNLVFIQQENQSLENKNQSLTEENKAWESKN
jgi:hypothetical protein